VSLQNFENFIVKKTEAVLTWRKRRRLIRKERSKRVHPVIDWISSILIIIVVVILINMFLFQNYRIPSESMVPVLQVGDLIFVEKVIFGPELLPGRIKFAPFRSPQRGEVVSFESELYAREGPFVELWYRFVYFITLSFVNLKTDENKAVIKDLLIKRVIGLGNERVRLYKGNFEILPECEENWLLENEVLEKAGVNYTIIWNNRRRSEPFVEKAISAPVKKILSFYYNGGEPFVYNPELSSYEQSPHFAALREKLLKSKLGWYVPEGMFFPMGDNREISRDGRAYGPVPLERIQGKAIFRFSPFTRFGGIE
jgi:signal peptidase I